MVISYNNDFPPTPYDWNSGVGEAEYCNWQYLNTIQSLEEKISSKFSEFSTRLTKIESRIASLESKESCISSSPSSSDSSSGIGCRKKRSPSDLQVC